MVKYEEIPVEISKFLEVTQEYFDTSPEFMRKAAFEYARRKWLEAGAPKADSLRYPIEYSVANEDLDEVPLDELTDYYYERYTRQSTMGIVDHRFSLCNTFNVPTAWQYLRMVSYQARELGATNATLQYIGSDDTVYNLSFSRNDLLAHENDVSTLLDLLKKGSAEWIRELYTGSDYIQDAITTYSLAMGRFTITVCHIQGGYGKMIPDYYQVLGLENNSDDCLIQCFLHIHHHTCNHSEKCSHIGLGPKGASTRLWRVAKENDDQCVENPRVVVPSASSVRKLLLKEGKLGLDCVPVLEQMFEINVDVLRDYRHLEFDNQRSIGKGVALIDSFRAVIVKDDPAEECHCLHTGNFVSYGKQYSKKQLVRELKKKYQPDAENLTQYDGSDDEQEDKDVYYYFFDYETVFDPKTMEILPYAYAIVKCDHKFNIIDKQCRIGLGCDTHLSDYLFSETPTEDETKYLVGYNNSRFDNFILLRHSLKHNNFVGHARFAGNTIVSTNINGFVVRDLCRIVNMSLDKACKAFKIELPKLTGAVKHHEVQMRFMDGVLDSYLVQMHDTIRKYVVRDLES
ncbi:hypothetical protein GGI13_004408 [Coemansia sp. RSA 455]|nr:hypothetical protein GGI13_004408 [Coemansia sp. RSA 455]